MLIILYKIDLENLYLAKNSLYQKPLFLRETARGPVTFIAFFPVLLFHLLCYLFSPFLQETAQNDPQGLMCLKPQHNQILQMMCSVGEKGPYAICEQRRSKWAYTFLQSDLDILWTYTTNLHVFCKRATKALISLCICADWSGPVLSANCIRALFVCWASN